MFRKCISSRKYQLVRTLCTKTEASDQFSAAYLADKTYWKQRYRKQEWSQEHFDWLADSDTTVEHVKSYLKTGSMILDLGCGTSSFAQKLCRNVNSPLAIYCLDFSQEALQVVSELISDEDKGNHTINFVHADATKISLRADMFDVILDKGTTDSVLKLDDREKAILMAGAILKESLRLLSPLGTLIQITDEDPDSRILLINELLKSQCDHTSVNVSPKLICEGEIWEYFMYTVKKH